MALTVQQIHAAATSIDAAGQKPTLAGIRAKLGSGSYSTISAALATWQRQDVQSSDLPSELPDDVQQAYDLAALTMWQLAVKSASMEFVSERKAFEARIADLEENLRVSSAAVDQLDVDVDSLRFKVASFEMLCADQQAIVADQSRSLQTANSMLEVAQSMASERLKTIDSLQSFLATVTVVPPVFELVPGPAPDVRDAKKPARPKKPPL